MSMYVAIAQSPTVDVSQVVGPFRSIDKAHEARNELEIKGYNVEVAPLVSLADVDDPPAWD